MSLEFNRRSFLKYTAAAAVVVAGSSLLTGCGDKYQKTGKFGAKLKLMGEHTATSPAYTVSSSTKTFTCTVNVKCTTKDNPLWIDNNSFQLTVKSGSTTKKYAGSCVTLPIDGQHGANHTLEKGDEQDFYVTVTLPASDTIADGDEIEFSFWPRYLTSTGTAGYTRVYVTWKGTAKAGTSGTITIE